MAISQLWSRPCVHRQLKNKNKKPSLDLARLKLTEDQLRCVLSRKLITNWVPRPVVRYLSLRAVRCPYTRCIRHYLRFADNKATRLHLRHVHGNILVAKPHLVAKRKEQLREAQQAKFEVEKGSRKERRRTVAAGRDGFAEAGPSSTRRNATTQSLERSGPLIAEDIADDPSARPTRSLRRSARNARPGHHPEPASAPVKKPFTQRRSPKCPYGAILEATAMNSDSELWGETWRMAWFHQGRASHPQKRWPKRWRDVAKKLIQLSDMDEEEVAREAQAVREAYPKVLHSTAADADNSDPPANDWQRDILTILRCMLKRKPKKPVLKRKRDPEPEIKSEPQDEVAFAPQHEEVPASQSAGTANRESRPTKRARKAAPMPKPEPASKSTPAASKKKAPASAKTTDRKPNALFEAYNSSKRKRNGPSTSAGPMPQADVQSTAHVGQPAATEQDNVLVQGTSPEPDLYAGREWTEWPEAKIPRWLDTFPGANDFCAPPSPPRNAATSHFDSIVARARARSLTPYVAPLASAQGDDENVFIEHKPLPNVTPGLHWNPAFHDLPASDPPEMLSDVEGLQDEEELSEAFSDDS